MPGAHGTHCVDAIWFAPANLIEHAFAMRAGNAYGMWDALQRCGLIYSADAT